jgi:hypothetical protein
VSKHILEGCSLKDQMLGGERPVLAATTGTMLLNQRRPQVKTEPAYPF